MGLRLRPADEKPVAADSPGVAVCRMTSAAAVVVSGAMARLGGLSPVVGSTHREGQTQVGDFIGLTVIFGNWCPGGLAAGARLLGCAEAVQLRAGSAVRPLVLAVASQRLRPPAADGQPYRRGQQS